MFHLDTDTCIAALKGDQRVVSRILMDPKSLSISAVVLGELYCGALNSKFVNRNLVVLREFVLGVEIVDFSQREAEVYGGICAHLLKIGKPTGEKDALIAATALAHNATLVTHNTRHFKNIPDLKLDDWMK